jgi:hypothetical protein
MGSDQSATDAPWEMARSCALVTRVIAGFVCGAWALLDGSRRSARYWPTAPSMAVEPRSGSTIARCGRGCATAASAPRCGVRFVDARERAAGTEPRQRATWAIMKRFKSPRQVQRFLSTHDQVANVFSRRPNQNTAAKFHSACHEAFDIWAEVTSVAMAA